MGLGYQALNFTLSLWKDGSFKDFKSIIELGSQDIHGEEHEIDLAVGSLTNNPGLKSRDHSLGKNVYHPKTFYSALGLTEYQCIDADGRNGALVLDLNTDIKAGGYARTFDVVTNHGTTEHCFNQHSAFLNIHNLCAKGGIMIHGLPFQGYLNHGFFNYQPDFFLDLARANDYEVLGVYVNIDAETADLSTYSDALMKHLTITPVSTVLLFVALRKTIDAPFQEPFHTKYLSESKFRDAYGFKKTPKLFLPLGIGSLEDTISARNLAKALSIKIKRRLVRVLGL